ncbi:hypothetical protein MesoLj113a_72820 [Mesorhizobium sp. 113-1-2]|nr:hypothetical protein MesoLj113a_72820 [Mesorhizobium sp. 113-1-2]
MAPLRGWAPRGERIKAKVPHSHWKTMTFLAALRHDRVHAPWLIDGLINGERFQLCVDKVLVPTLKAVDLDRLGAEADVIVTITSSFAPILKRSQIKAGTHLACMGTDTKAKQEVAAEHVAAVALFADEVAQSISI